MLYNGNYTKREIDKPLLVLIVVSCVLIILTAALIVSQIITANEEPKSPSVISGVIDSINVKDGKYYFTLENGERYFVSSNIYGRLKSQIDTLEVGDAITMLAYTQNTVNGVVGIEREGVSIFSQEDAKKIAEDNDRYELLFTVVLAVLTPAFSLLLVQRIVNIRRARRAKPQNLLEKRLISALAEDNVKVLWSGTQQSRQYGAYVAKYSSIPVAVFFVIGIILATVNIINWIGLVVFGSIALFSFGLLVIFSLLSGQETAYAVTDRGIIINQKTQWLSLLYSEIEQIKISHFLFNKRNGSIIFIPKDKNPTVSYRFNYVGAVDKVYQLLLRSKNEFDSNNA